VSWHVVGHDEQHRRLSAAWRAGRLAHSYLFVGPPGIGKRTFARAFAQAALCHRPRGESLTPCGECGSCKVFEAGGHPDFFEAEKEADRNEFRIEVIRDLLPKLSLKPALGERRVAVVDDVDRFNDEAANAFLKTLEEPPPGSLLILIATGVESLLSTIRSRCQSMVFSPLSIQETAAVMLRLRVATSDEEVHALAEAAGGSLEGVEELKDEVWRRLRTDLQGRLAKPAPDLVRFAKDLSKFCEDGVKEAAEKRRRAIAIVRMALHLFAQALRTKSAGGPASDAVAKAAEMSEEALLDLVERTLEADEQVRRYLHLPTVIDCWIDDLAQIAAGAYAPSV
jgi:DNA polymerase-3 subunit delta'